LNSAYWTSALTLIRSASALAFASEIEAPEVLIAYVSAYNINNSLFDLADCAKSFDFETSSSPFDSSSYLIAWCLAANSYFFVVISIFNVWAFIKESLILVSTGSGFCTSTLVIHKLFIENNHSLLGVPSLFDPNTAV